MMECLKNVFGFDVDVEEVRPWWNGSGIVLGVGVSETIFARGRSWIITRISPDGYGVSVDGVW